MQNKIFAAILFGSLLFSSMVSAKITPIKQYKFGELNLQSNFRCEDTTGYYSSEPAGYQCSEKNIKGHKCYHNCTLVCNSRDYPYTQDNCVTDKNGTLGGESCAADGVNRYKTCSCSAEYKTCDSPKTHSGEKCTAGGEIKYKNCVCPAEYQYTCDGANQRGSGQPCDGKYTACNTGGCADIYNKSCDGPGEEGNGDGCGGKYTSCKCKNTYHTCTGTGEVGFGTACTADGDNKYTSCKCKNTYHTCTGTGVVGNETACTADGDNKYTSCKCKNTYHTCAANETGVGEPCTIDGGNKYTSCEEVPQCSPGDILADDSNCYSTLPAGRTAVGIMFTNDLAIDLLESDRISMGYYESWGESRQGHGQSSCDGNCAPFLRGATYPAYLTTESRFIESTASVAYHCTKSYCNHLNSSGYAGYWFLPSAADITALKANWQSYVSGMALAGRPSEVTSSEDALLDIATRKLHSTGACYTYEGGGQSADDWVIYPAGNINYGGTYKRCIRRRSVTSEPMGTCFSPYNGNVSYNDYFGETWMMPCQSATDPGYNEEVSHDLRP